MNKLAVYLSRFARTIVSDETDEEKPASSVVEQAGGQFVNKDY